MAPLTVAGGRPDRGPLTRGMKESHGQGEKKSPHLSFDQTQAKPVGRWEAAVQHLRQQHTEYPFFWGGGPSRWQTEWGQATFAGIHTPALPGLDGRPVSSEPGREACKAPSRLPEINTLSAQEATDKKESQCPKYNLTSVEY